MKFFSLAREYENIVNQFDHFCLMLITRAGSFPGGKIVLSRERTERSRTIPSFRKNNEHLEPVLKNIGTISKRMKWNGTGIA